MAELLNLNMASSWWGMSAFLTTSMAGGCWASANVNRMLQTFTDDDEDDDYYSNIYWTAFKATTGAGVALYGVYKGCKMVTNKLF